MYYLKKKNKQLWDTNRKFGYILQQQKNEQEMVYNGILAWSSPDL